MYNIIGLSAAVFIQMFPNTGSADKVDKFLNFHIIRWNTTQNTLHITLTGARDVTLSRSNQTGTS